MYNEDYFKKERWFQDNGLLRPDQLAALCYALGRPFWHFHEDLRDPGLTYSIGAGIGDLEVKLEQLGCDVIGVEPHARYRGKKRTNTYEGGGKTIIFCESIEHLPRDETRRILDLAPNGCRIIIVNWPDFHPIPTDNTGWDHITRIDDDFYDEISKDHKVILRKGSHLVMEKEE